MDVHVTGDVSPDRVDATADVASIDGTDARSDVVGDRGASDADGAGATPTAPDRWTPGIRALLVTVAATHW